MMPLPASVTAPELSTSTAPAKMKSVPRKVDQARVASAFKRNRKPLLEPAPNSAPGVVGKSAPPPRPVTYTLPAPSTAIAVAAFAPEPPTSTDHSTAPLGEYFVTKTELVPDGPIRGAVEGKSADEVVPVTYTLPCRSVASATAWSASDPPRYVAHCVVPSGDSLATNASVEIE